MIPLHRLRRVTARWSALVVALVAALATVLAPATPASAWSYGFNRVQSASEDASTGTGYGPGWVTLSYQPDDPVIGYLFAAGTAGEGGTDHMDIHGLVSFSNGETYPWGYAYGNFKGCAYAYGTQKFAIEDRTNHSGECGSRPGHTSAIFCADHARDYLCNNRNIPGHSDTPQVGVMSPLYPVTSNGCTGYGNLGNAAFTGSGASGTPTNYLGTVPAGNQLDLRYVTKDDKWVMAKWHDHTLASGTHWAFFPRTCVTYATGA
ncbi:MAG: hypothetical protein WCA46_21525 [Actinocatenispora sp.]